MREKWYSVDGVQRNSKILMINDACDGLFIGIFKCKLFFCSNMLKIVRNRFVLDPNSKKELLLMKTCLTVIQKIELVIAT